MAEIHFYLHESASALDWARRHGEGDVPDLAPYGLHRLAAHGHSLTFEDPPPRRSRDVARALFSRSSQGGTRVAAAWDEFTAMRMAAQETDALLCTGIIWATDLLTSRSPAVRAKLSYMRSVLRRFSLVWCLSRAQLNPLAEWLGNGGPSVKFLPFGIDEQFFEMSSARRKGSPTLLSFGHDHDRDPITLLRALEVVISQRPDVQAYVQVQPHSRLPHGVHALPRMSHHELRAHIAAASVVVTATRHNLHLSGMTASLESMSMGTPSVLTETPGYADYRPEWLDLPPHRPGDWQGLADATLAAMERSDVGGRLRDYVISEHTSARMVASLSGLVHEVVSESSARAH